MFLVTTVIFKFFQILGILRLQMTVGLVKIIEDFMTYLPCFKKGIKIFPKIRKPSTAVNKTNQIGNKKIYICPNKTEAKRNVRIDDHGVEIILNSVLSPWIIENIFKIKTLANNSEEFTIKKEQFLKLVKDMNSIKKELSIMSTKLKTTQNQ